MDSDYTKNQHYVPQGYLKNFTFDEGMTKVYCLNKLSGKKFTPNIRNIASENYFYELSPEDAIEFENDMGYSNFNHDEKWFRIFEGEALPLLDNLVSLCNNANQEKLLSFLYKEENRLWIGVFLLLQYYRTKKFRETLLKEGLSLGEKALRERSDYSKDQLLNDAKKYSVLQQMINYLDLYKLNDELNLIGNYIWQIGKNDTNIPFITSDNPIIDLSTNFENGKSVKTWVIPLNDKYCLCVYFDFFTGELNYLTQYPLVSLNKECVLSYNSLQLNQAQTFIFSKLPI